MYIFKPWISDVGSDHYANCVIIGRYECFSNEAVLALVVVSMLALYSDDPSLYTTEANSFFCKICV